MAFALPRWDRHGILFAIACVAITTSFFVPGRDLFAKGQWALLYLLLVTFVAGVAGFRASLVASVLSFFSWNYFLLPPYGTLAIHDPKDWLSLLVFLIVGIVMGVLTSRMSQREAEALARERESTLLSRVSAGLVSMSSMEAMIRLLRDEIAAVTGAQEVCLFLPGADGRLARLAVSGSDSTGNEDAGVLEWVCREKTAVGLAKHPDMVGVTETLPVASAAPGILRDRRYDVYLPIQTVTGFEGVLVVYERVDRQPFTPHDTRLLASIACLVAGFLERRRLESAAANAEAFREADRLKSTLISSVSHELKTPLSAMTAAVTSILEGDVAWDEGALRSELTAVGKDLVQLNDSIGALLELSRLKADAWAPQREWYELGEILGSALDKLPVGSRQRIAFEIPGSLPLLHVDFLQWQQALLHVLENALAYSPTETPVIVGALEKPQETWVWVEDHGPGVPNEERERIFEQFYRGAVAAVAPKGTGLGLAITGEIVRFHGGRIWVEAVEPHGARFVIALPCDEEAEGDIDDASGRGDDDPGCR